jgi:hypothetical protein
VQAGSGRTVVAAVVVVVVARRDREAQTIQGHQHSGCFQQRNAATKKGERETREGRMKRDESFF